MRFACARSVSRNASPPRACSIIITNFARTKIPWTSCLSACLPASIAKRFKIRVKLTEVAGHAIIVDRGKREQVNERRAKRGEGERRAEMRRAKELEPDRLMAYQFGTRSKVRLSARDASTMAAGIGGRRGKSRMWTDGRPIS